MICLTAREITVIQDAKKRLDIVNHLISQGVTDVESLRTNVSFITETQKVNPSFNLETFRMVDGVRDMG